MEVAVQLIPALEDNYIYLITWKKKAIVIDPSEAEPVFEILESENLILDDILITHHHTDHVAGCEALQYDSKCAIIGPNDDRIPGLSEIVHDGETVAIGPLEFHVLSVPGHTATHIAYHVPRQNWLFCGDCLFGGGCGRLFEGTPEEMLNSLQKIVVLPDETLIFCGHEYTLKNMQFALQIEPENHEVKKRLEETQKLSIEGRATVPSTLAIEKKTNPFLRVDKESLRLALGMESASDLNVFTSIREMRNNF